MIVPVAHQPRITLYGRTSNDVTTNPVAGCDWHHTILLWISFAPTGDPNDSTRDPNAYDSTAAYLQSCGVPLHTPD